MHALGTPSKIQKMRILVAAAEKNKNLVKT